MCAIVCLLSSELSALPKPGGPINDFADVLSMAQETELSALSRGLEDATTAELAVAVVTSLEGLTVEQYAEQLFREWGVGQRGKDNGVLVLVAPAEREMRIEVGYGLEGVLPDGLAGEIIRASFIPRFRENDYGAGVVEGTRRVAEIVRRNDVLSVEQRAAYERAAPGAPSAWFLVPFLGIFVSIGFLLVGVGVAAQDHGGRDLRRDFRRRPIVVVASSSFPSSASWSCAALPRQGRRWACTSAVPRVAS